MSTEVAHYVTTAHPPGGVLCSCQSNFIEKNAPLVTIAKSRRLEFRLPCAQNSDAPVLLSLPINGRIMHLAPIYLASHDTDLVFFMTDKFHYAVIVSSPAASPYPVSTVASGNIRQSHSSLLSREAESAPLVAVDRRCIVSHLFDGFLTIINVNSSYTVPSQAPRKGSADATNTNTAAAPKTITTPLLGDPYHLRIEERAILALDVLYDHNYALSPRVAILHQDSRGHQHLAVYSLDLQSRQLTHLWKKQRIDGGSSTLIPLLPIVSAAGATTTSDAGILVLGQRQITHLMPSSTKLVPLPTCLLLAHCPLPPTNNSGQRHLLADEFGNVHMLTVNVANGCVSGLHLDTLGSLPTLLSALEFVQPGHVFCGSQLGDSLLVQIHQEPTEEDGYLTVVEEYTHLGPIVDADWVSTHSASVVTASGSSIAGSLRLVRNGIGMKEYAAVEIPGIQNMWSIRPSFQAWHDKYLVQSFVAETRVLGAATVEESMGDGADDEEGGSTLEEVVLPGLDSTSTSLYVGNVQLEDSLLQITETQVRLLDMATMTCVQTWSPGDAMMEEEITVAAANEAGQIILALRGGHLVYLKIEEKHVISVTSKAQMTSEISCLDLNPFVSPSSMETDGRQDAQVAGLVAVGLWDDFTVRILALEEDLKESLEVNLSTYDEDVDTEAVQGVASPVRRSRNNMMARSLCMITLHSSSNAGSESCGVNMLFVGLGDGTLISFAVVQENGYVNVQSKKEVSLGTQRIHLVPLLTEKGGACILATGDRPTVIYLGGGGSRNLTPKLCYSSVNLSSEVDEEGASSPSENIAVNVAAPFYCPQLFDDSSLSSKHYSLCVSDDSILRLGVIDDIQKLHVSTCRLGMAPRRVVHCPEGRLFAVGCIESGIKQMGSGSDEPSMGNCIRFLDDTAFDDIERIDLEPHEMILSMANINLSIVTKDASGSTGSKAALKPFLLVGTGYALPDEEEPLSGRVFAFSCEDEDGSTSRSIKQVTELHVNGGVHSMCQFYDGMALMTVNSKTQVCRLTQDGSLKFEFAGLGHHGQILSLMVKSRAEKELPQKSSEEEKPASVEAQSPMKKPSAKPKNDEQLAIIGDLMRSISLCQYYPEHQTLEEIARDFNANWTTAIEMLSDNLYLGAENWNNLYVLRRNVKATSEEVRCRLDTVGQFHLGEMVNKFIPGSLMMSQAQSNNSTAGSSRRKSSSPPSKTAKDKGSGTQRIRRPYVCIGSQTLFVTVDGTLGTILGLDARTAAFFITLERCMAKEITPIGKLSHQDFRTFDAQRRVLPAQNFCDGDLCEAFLDLDRFTMEKIVAEMNRDGGWEINAHGKQKDDLEENESPGNENMLGLEDVLAMVEEMTMCH